MERISYREASEKSIVCNESKMFITVFTTAWSTLVQSTHYHAISVTSDVILSFHLGIVLASNLFTSTSLTILPALSSLSLSENKNHQTVSSE